MALKIKLAQWYKTKQRYKIIDRIMETSNHMHGDLKSKIKSLYMDDKRIIGQALFKGIISLGDVKEEFKHDIDIVRYALKRDGRALKYAATKFRDDVELIKLIVTHNTDVLYYASQNILNDKDLFLDWVPKYPSVIKHLSPLLQQDTEFIYKLLDKNLEGYQYLTDKLKKNKHLALNVVKKDFNCIKHMNATLQKDIDIVLTASYYSRDEKPNGYPAPFYHHYVIHSPEARYVYKHRYTISEHTFPIVKKALLTNSSAMLNPPECIKTLIENTEDSYLVLAHYAIGQNMTIATDVQLPDNLLY